MEISYIITIFLIGFIGSYVSGMLGIGGSIIKYPMLLYIPPIFGLAAFSAHEVSGISAVQVFFATIGGIMAYRKGGFLNKKLIAYMGTSILMMFIPNKGQKDIPLEEVTFNKPLAAGLAFVVGIGSGIVGAAGAFLLVPIMLVVLKIPTRMTIASSLAITFISSIGSMAGKLTTGQVEFLPALIMVIASLIASPLGAAFGKKVNAKVLKNILAVVILATAVKIWLDIL